MNIDIYITYLERMRPIIIRRLCKALLLLLPLLVTGQIGCTRSMLQDGTKVAQMGTATAKQMAQYYETLQKDTIDTYELNAFREAYLLEKSYRSDADKAKREGKQLPLAPKVGLSEVDKQILKEYQKTYQALEARIQLSHSMQDAYDSYAHLNDYNAVAEVDKAISGLSKTVGAASNLVLPDPTGAVTAVVQGLFKDIINELAMVQENRAIVSGSERLARVLDKLQQVFDSEKILYGGDRTVKDSQGKDMNISGIAGRRAAAYKSVAELLVESDAVITTSMVSRVLGQYDFSWPDTQVPFTDAPLKAGIIKMIEARSFPIAQLTEDAGDGISRSLSKLSTLHKQLAAEKPLSLQEAMENSATVQVLLNQLKARNYPTDLLMEVLKAINKGA